jgi:hypothetical protein
MSFCKCHNVPPQERERERRKKEKERERDREKERKKIPNIRKGWRNGS